MAIVDAGDEFLGDSLQAMISALVDDPTLDVAYCMAVQASGMLANALIPELCRLKKTPYLSRGYVVRRSFLERIGGFSLDPQLDGFTDHCFWMEVARRGARALLLRRIGMKFWPQVEQRSLASENPAGVVHRLCELDAMQAV